VDFIKGIIVSKESWCTAYEDAYFELFPNETEIDDEQHYQVVQLANKLDAEREGELIDTATIRE